MIEIKSSANQDNALLFSKKTKFYKKKTKIEPELLLIAVSVTDKGGEVYKMLNIKVITYDEMV
ncbi:MAG: hypothetical protein V2A53_10615 [bacterium]